MDQVEEVKQKTNIATLIGGYVSLKKAGRNFKGLCPFHGEKTASFMVNEELGIYKCFGCGAGGDAISFLMEIEGLEFGEALEKLAAKAGVKLKPFKGREKSLKQELLAVVDLAAEYYHFLLTKHPEGETARKYLAERGIKEKLTETFRLGYALSEWDGLVKYLVKKKGYEPDLLVAAGLAMKTENRLYDRFRGRLIFPLLDTAGRVVGFTGRVLPGAKSDEPKYVNSPETEIYHKGKMLYGLTVARSEIKKKGRVVLVEGQMDMISSFGAGVGETVAVGGTALTGEMVEILGRLTGNLIMALDNDYAGEAAMKRSIAVCESRGLNIKMVSISGGKDPDEIARKNPGDWKEMVEKAVPIYEFFFDKAVGRYGTETAEAIGKIVKEVIPYLAKIGNSVVREVWVRKLAEKVGVDKARVWEELEKERAGLPTGSTAVKVEKQAGGDEGRRLMAALMGAKAELIAKLKKMLLGMPAVEAEGKLLAAILAEGEIADATKFIAGLPEEIAGLAREAYLMQPAEPLAEKDIIKLTVNWAKKVVREEIERLMMEQRRAEERGDQALLDNLGAKVVKLASLQNKLVWD